MVCSREDEAKCFGSDQVIETMGSQESNNIYTILYYIHMVVLMHDIFSFLIDKAYREYMIFRLIRLKYSINGNSLH